MEIQEIKTISMMVGLGLIGYGVYRILIKSYTEDFKVNNQQEYDEKLKEAGDDLLYGIGAIIVGILILGAVFGTTL